MAVRREGPFDVHVRLIVLDKSSSVHTFSLGGQQGPRSEQVTDGISEGGIMGGPISGKKGKGDEDSLCR
jgi:hypothetical protein